MVTLPQLRSTFEVLQECLRRSCPQGLPRHHRVGQGRLQALAHQYYQVEGHQQHLIGWLKGLQELQQMSWWLQRVQQHLSSCLQNHQQPLALSWSPLHVHTMCIPLICCVLSVTSDALAVLPTHGVSKEARHVPRLRVTATPVPAPSDS